MRFLIGFSLILPICFSTAIAMAEKPASPLDEAFNETTYDESFLYHHAGGKDYKLLAFEAFNADGPILRRGHYAQKQDELDVPPKKKKRDARNSTEKIRADVFCRILNFTGSVRDTIQSNVMNYPVYNVQSRQTFEPDICFSSSDEMEAQVAKLHFLQSTPLSNFLENEPCSQQTVDQAVKQGYAIDGNGMSPEAYKAMEAEVKSKMGFTPGKILRSSYFTSITCSNEPEPPK